MNDHAWLQENLATYLADGLDADERQRAEKHVAECAACARRVKEAKALETYVTDLLSGARPDAALETRAVQALHKSQMSRPKWLRFVIAAAAVVVLGVVGAIAQMATGQGEMPIALNNLRFFGRDAHATFSSVGTAIGRGEVAGSPLALSQLDDSRSMREDAEVVNGERMEKRTKGIDGSDLFNITVKPPGDPNVEGGRRPEGNEVAAGENQMHSYLRHSPAGATPAVSGKLGGLVSGLTPNGTLTPDLADSFYRESAVRGGDGPTDEMRRLAPESTPPRQPVAAAKLPDPAGVLIVPQDTRGFFTGESGKEMYAKSPPAPPGRDNTLNFGLSFYRNDLKPGDPKALPVGEVIIVPNPTPAKPTEKNEPPKEAPKDRLPEGGSKPGHFSPVSQPEKGQPPQPADTGLKIIRTGDMEFEVTSYDAAFKNIDKLIAGVKGGFVLRENSKKQENGKKRGTVIVRMPPQFLTKFMDDLKADLEKAGELKTQSIGSQDVTKEFIDTDGELRMLRVQEGRLLDIIKNPKGEVKDLLLAEEKLGITRVRIEKLEGQIRYLSNQVGLSTLTINLVEKEIQAATGMVITEKVQMLVEVDNVAEAKDAVIKAAEDLKGRVVKSEFKQEKAGQLEAIIHAQIPPDKRKAFSEQLEKLGLVSDRESSQSQKAEGGTKAPFELKRRTEDVLFEVTLNNIVGMNPRRAVVMVVATTDVPANYKKLEDAVRAAQGRILEGKLLDPDKQRITGFLRFEVPTDKKAALDKQLAEFGPAVNREEQELKANIRATEQRYGYAVHLRSLATLPARENVTVSIVDVKDVQQKASELAELARKNKGVADKAEVTLTRQGEKRATVILNVPLSSSDALLEEFKKAGKVMEMKQTPNRQVPEHDLATAQITLNLTGGSPIVPSDEGLWPRIRSGLYLSFQVFAWCITVVIIGIAGVLPWVLVIWGGVKLMTWFAKK